MSYNQSNGSYWKNYGAMYTQTVGDLVKNGFQFNLQDYPIWNEDKRPYLNNLIINHFYMNEIGVETEGYFNKMLGAKMHEIMPYYNRLFEAMELEYDPLIDHNKLERHDETGTNDNINTTTLGRKYSDTALHSDTPQNDLGNMSTETESGVFAQYLTDAQKRYGNENYSGEKDHIDQDTTRNYTHEYSGRSASGQELAIKYAETARKLYSEILKELDPLFMGLFR